VARCWGQRARRRTHASAAREQPVKLVPERLELEDGRAPRPLEEVADEELVRLGGLVSELVVDGKLDDDEVKLVGQVQLRAHRVVPRPLARLGAVDKAVLRGPAGALHDLAAGLRKPRVEVVEEAHVHVELRVHHLVVHPHALPGAVGPADDGEAHGLARPPLGQHALQARVALWG
jgi:hypothetical protein